MKFNFNNSQVTINVSAEEFEKIAPVLVSEVQEGIVLPALTEKEYYTLRCVMAYLRYTDETKSLLNKITSQEEDELGLEDFEKVIFEIDEQGNNVINFEE